MSPALRLTFALQRYERASAELQEAALALDSAAKLVAGLVPVDLPDVQAIVHEVAEDYRVMPVVILGRAKLVEIAEPRHVAMYLSRVLTPHSMAPVARAFGRVHSSLVHNHKYVEDRMSLDKAFAARVARLRAKCAQRLERMAPKEARAM